MRQLTDSTGAVTFARTYDPYGVVTTSTGASSSGYGFTGEYQQDSLVYLRARHYAPGMGRFLTRDTWPGEVNRPLSLNRWGYVEANPVNWTDSTGNSIYAGLCMGQVFSQGLILNMSAERLIDLCKDFYSPSYWRTFGLAGIGPFDCNSKEIWRKPTNASELFRDYICERGPKDVPFNGNDTLTKKLAHSILMDEIRRDYYQGNKKYPEEYRFGSIPKYFKEFGDLLVDQEFPLVHVLGSVDVSAGPAYGGRVRFWVHNRTDLASGTHFVGRFPPDGEGLMPYSLEKHIADHPEQAKWSAWWLINSHPTIVSILSPRERSETEPGMGGGNYTQTFVWTERDVSCEMQDRPWPKYLPYLDIGYSPPLPIGVGVR